MKSKEKIIGIIVGFIFTVGFVYSKADDFFSAPKIDIFKVPTVTLENTPYQIAEVENKNIIINIWATWCAPCIKEMPYLTSLHERLNPEAWKIILISDEELNKIQSFKDKHTLNLNMLKAQKPLKDYGIKGYPTTYVIDRNGEIVFNRNGGLELFQSEFEKSITKLDATFASTVYKK